MNRRTLIVAGLGCVALLAAWFLLFWSPAGADIAEARGRVTEAERQADELEVRLSRLLDAQRRIDDLVEAAELFDAAVPAEPELAEFLLLAHALAEEVEVDFLAINPSAPVASTLSGVGSEIQLTFQVDGGYFHVLDFVDGLLDLPRIVMLDSINVTTGGEGPQEGALSVSLSGRMFTSLPPGAPVGSTPDAGVTTSPTTTPDAVAAPDATSEGGT